MNSREITMKKIIDLLYEARLLKEIERSGYNFLGCGSESVAEHSFTTAFAGYVLSKMEPGADSLRLITMCLVHDLPEARTGDINHLQKHYVTADTNKAIKEMTSGIDFGSSLADLIHDFNEGKSIESLLAHDADQISFILELKTLSEKGFNSPKTWLPLVVKRLKTEKGRLLAEKIMETGCDEWWLNKFIDSKDIQK